MLFRCKQLLRPAPKASITFCIAHFNLSKFPDAGLHAIRRFHPAARVIVADARAIFQYCSALQEIRVLRTPRPRD